MRWLTLLFLGLLLAAGCDDDARLIVDPPASPYVAYDSPDHLVANLALAWERLDLAEYRDSILYDGVELATDGNAYEPFTFYYDRSLDPDLPEYDSYEREIVRAVGMMSGLPGQDSDGNVIPGIKSISITLTPIGPWADPLNPDEIDGDPYPAGTTWRSYDADIEVTLKANIGGTDINGWLVETTFIFHCIPVQAEGGTRWKLWKWREVNGRGVDSASWGSIKALY